MVKYLWQKANWTKFKWDSDKVISHLAIARKSQGAIIAQADQIELKDLSELIADEAINTSKIEGEVIDAGSIRSSIAKRLGLPTAGFSSPTKQSDGLVEILIDATTNYQTKLTKKRLCGWQAALFPTGHSGISKINVGKYRSGNEPMQVVSGPIGKEKIHYLAPSSKNVIKEMKQFFDWWNSKNSFDGIIRAAIAHLWFVTIHPFDDGNGRITRAITDMAIAQDEKTSKRLYSLSTQIMKDRKNYYDILEKTQKSSGDITDWLIWFLTMYTRAIQNSKTLIEGSLLMARFYKHFAAISMNDRQSKVIRKLLESLPEIFTGGLTNKKYVSIAKTSSESAKRDIKDLVEKGLLLINESRGRSTSYRLNFKIKPSSDLF